jgi:hypothetical protein
MTVVLCADARCADRHGHGPICVKTGSTKQTAGGDDDPTAGAGVPARRAGQGWEAVGVLGIGLAGVVPSACSEAGSSRRRRRPRRSSGCSSSCGASRVWSSRRHWPSWSTSISPSPRASRPCSGSRTRNAVTPRSGPSSRGSSSTPSPARSRRVPPDGAVRRGHRAPARRMARARAQRHRPPGPGRIRPPHAQKRTRQAAQDEGERARRSPAGDRARRGRPADGRRRVPAPVPIPPRRLPASTICGTPSRPSRSAPASRRSTSPATWEQAWP